MIEIVVSAAEGEETLAEAIAGVEAPAEASEGVEEVEEGEVAEVAEIAGDTIEDPRRKKSPSRESWRVWIRGWTTTGLDQMTTKRIT